MNANMSMNMGIIRRDLRLMNVYRKNWNEIPKTNPSTSTSKNAPPKPPSSSPAPSRSQIGFFRRFMPTRLTPRLLMLFFRLMMIWEKVLKVLVWMRVDR